jgi:hypothetical protein
MSNNIKVRVGQQPAIKVLTTGTTGGGAGGGSLETLSDVLISNKANGQILVYQSSSNKWINSSTALELNVDGGTY